MTFSGLYGQRSHQEHALTAHRRKALDLFSAIRTAALRLTQLSERCSRSQSDLRVLGCLRLQWLDLRTSDLNFHVLGGLGPRLLGAIAL